MEVGQYHNAIYADGELFTFGWGIWGQLGHGDILTSDRPKRVRFFSAKSIKQIALGHAHTLVLCSNSHNDRQKSRQLTGYVFGCNLFGALGTGQYQCDSPTQQCLKSTIPVEIDIYNETITQIHTKFSTNVSVSFSQFVCVSQCVSVGLHELLHKFSCIFILVCYHEKQQIVYVGRFTAINSSIESVMQTCTHGSKM